MRSLKRWGSVSTLNWKMLLWISFIVGLSLVMFAHQSWQDIPLLPNLKFFLLSIPFKVLNQISTTLVSLHLNTASAKGFLCSCTILYWKMQYSLYWPEHSVCTHSYHVDNLVSRSTSFCLILWWFPCLLYRVFLEDIVSDSSWRASKLFKNLT